VRRSKSAHRRKNALNEYASSVPSVPIQSKVREIAAKGPLGNN
jgi:hypothetical protein